MTRVRTGCGVLCTVSAPEFILVWTTVPRTHLSLLEWGVPKGLGASAPVRDSSGESFAAVLSFV